MIVFATEDSDGENILPQSGYLRDKNSESKERRNRDAKRVHPDRKYYPELNLKETKVVIQDTLFEVCISNNLFKIKSPKLVCFACV